MIPTTVLLAAVAALPLILNLLSLRTDLKRLRDLAARPPECPPVEPGGGAERISFLVAAWNEEHTLRPCLEALLQLGYPDFEVIVCAGGTDKTWEVADAVKDPRVVWLRQHAGEGKQGALQRCLERASGAIVYTIDADSRLTGSAFRRMVGPILSGAEQAVTGDPCEPLAEQRGMPFVEGQRACRIYTALWQPEHGSGLLGGNSAVRRRAVLDAGGFPTGVNAGGDYDLGQRLAANGILARYVVGAQFPTEYHAELGAYVRQQARWIGNVVVQGTRHGAFGEVAKCMGTSLLGAAMLLIPLVVAALVWWPVGPEWLVWVLAGGWMFAYWHAVLSRLRYLLVAARWTGERVNWAVAVRQPLFLLIDFYAWSRALARYPTRARRRQL